MSRTNRTWETVRHEAVGQPGGAFDHDHSCARLDGDTARDVRADPFLGSSVAHAVTEPLRAERVP
jgi:hypothetical protein